MDETPGARAERRKRKEDIARKDLLLDELARLASNYGQLANRFGDEELLLASEELAEWVAQTREARPEA